jgi:hypothetical protein
VFGELADGATTIFEHFGSFCLQAKEYTFEVDRHAEN